VTTNYLTALQQRLEQQAPKTWKQDLAAAYMAASYQLMKQDNLAAAMIGRINLGLASWTSASVWQSSTRLFGALITTMRCATGKSSICWRGTSPAGRPTET